MSLIWQTPIKISWLALSEVGISVTISVTMLPRLHVTSVYIWSSAPVTLVGVEHGQKSGPLCITPPIIHLIRLAVTNDLSLEYQAACTIISNNELKGWVKL